MGERMKGSALGAIAADLAEQGSAVALTGADGENSGGGEALGDLFLALDDEVAEHDGATVAPRKRGRGRPAGVPNRSTAEIKRYLAARGYRDPLEFLAALYSADTRELAANLKGLPVNAVGFDEAEAVLEIQRKAAAEAVAYMHSKMPAQVEIRGEAARPLIIINEAPAGGAVRVGGGGTMSAFEEVTAEAVRVSDQRVTAIDAGDAATTSHDDPSHDARQAVEIKR